MKKPFVEINSDKFILNPFNTKPIAGYEIPINKDTLEEFPNCCAFHKKVYSNAVEWFEEFPFCCKFHKNMISEWWFDKKRFIGVENKITKQVSYTEYHLEQKIQSEDWYEDICNYIEYNVFSFGQPAIGLHVYLHSIRYVIDNLLFKFGIKENQRIKLNEYLDTFYFDSKESKEKSEESNLNILHGQYQQWLKIFPFELSFFKSIKSHFQNQLPIGNGKPTFNKYTGMSSVKLHTQTTLFEYLLKVTDLLLTQVNTCILYDNGKLKEPEKIKIELLLNERKLKLKKGYVSKASNQDTRFRKILKDWFKDEKKFLKEITPLLKDLPPIKTKDVNLSNLITHKDSERIVSEIKVQYENIKGKRLKLLLMSLQELNLLPKDRITQQFYNCCKSEFDWDIASYTAVNDYCFNERIDKEEFSSMIDFIKELIKE